MKEAVREGLDSLIDWAKVASSAMSSSLKDVIAKLIGSVLDEDIETSNAEVIEDVNLNHHAGVLIRPAAPSSDGAMEAMFVRRGDEAEVIATREPRWQVDLEEGEVVVRAFGSDAALIRLTPDGDCIVAGNLLAGSDSVTEAMVLGTTLKSYLDSLKTSLDTHTHTVPITGAAGTTASTPPLVPSPAVPTIESSKHKLD